MEEHGDISGPDRAGVIHRHLSGSYPSAPAMSRLCFSTSLPRVMSTSRRSTGFGEQDASSTRMVPDSPPAVLATSLPSVSAMKRITGESSEVKFGPSSQAFGKVKVL